MGGWAGEGLGRGRAVVEGPDRVCRMTGGGAGVKAGCRGVGQVDIDSERPTLLLQGHRAGRVNGLATHPSRRLFVTGGDDQTVRVWDMDSRKQVAKRRSRRR